MYFRPALFLLALHLGVSGATAQSIATANSLATPPQTDPPAIALKVQDFKRLDSTTGWANTGNQLLLTTDNGAHWKDISPSAPAQAVSHDHKFSGVFFLNAQTGWVLYTTDADDSSQGTETGPPALYNNYLEATVDGGATWTTVSQLPSLRALEATGAGFLVFSDLLHGWANLDVVRGGVLFATSDGGSTWQREASGPGIGSNLAAPDNQDLWMAGGIDDKLFATHNGGTSFQEVALPLPANVDPNSYPTYSLPTFTDTRNGYETVDYSAGEKKSAIALFSTADGGQTWTLDREVLNLAPSSPGEETPDAIAGSTWILPLAPAGQQPTLMQLIVGSRPVDGAASNLRYFDCDLSFRSPSQGWMNCSGDLFSTEDGGVTRTSITPRVRNGALTTDPITPAVAPAPVRSAESAPATALSSLSAAPAPGVSQRLGFDSTDVLSSSDMGTWWNASPYYDVGFYLPHSPNRHNDPTLVANNGQGGIDWIGAVASQGWGLVPIWFGLQPPCANATFSGSISTDAKKAAAQGAEQADKAYDSATNLGLDGSVIYFDIEPYGISKQCSAAVTAYVGGFVGELKDDSPGASVGVYAQVYAAPTDLYNSNPRPDNIWIANNSDRVTVWNLGQGRAKVLDAAMTDDLWPNFQRMHQYRIDTATTPVIERWGGVPAKRHTFDDDDVDSTIYPGSGFKNFSPSSLALSTFSAGYNTVLYDIANGVSSASGFSRGKLVGVDFSEYGNPYSGSSGFLSSQGEQTSGLTCPGAGVTVPSGINNIGDVVGEYCSVSDPGCGQGHGFLYTKKNGCVTMDYPGSAWNALTGINDAGWILGIYQNEAAGGYLDGIVHCAIYKPTPTGGYTSSAFNEGGSNCFSIGINGFGQIVSYYYNDQTGQSETATFDDAEGGPPGAHTAILSSPTGQTEPRGINNNGLIAGNDLGLGTGFVINGPNYIQLDIPGAPGSSIFGFNDDLELVGFYYNGTADVGIVLDAPH